MEEIRTHELSVRRLGFAMGMLFSLLYAAFSWKCMGVFACGDVTDVFAKWTIIASGEGAKAALKAKEFLSAKTQNQHIKSI